MKVKDKINVLKYFFNVFNIVLLILGLLNLGCGIWITFDQKNVFKHLVSVDAFYQFLSVFSHILISDGTILSIISLFGFLAIAKDMKLVLVLYSGFLVLLVTIGFVIEVLLLLYFYHGLVFHILIDKIQGSISQYGKSVFTESRPEWITMDTVQRQFECCGIHNYSDWLEGQIQTGPYKLPCSCSNSSMDGLFCELYEPAIFDVVYSLSFLGCEVKISRHYHGDVLFMSGLTVSMLIFEVSQIVVTITLIKSIHMLRNDSQGLKKFLQRVRKESVDALWLHPILWNIEGLHFMVEKAVELMYYVANFHSF
ncbi:tetraspanin-19 [Pelodytes ibericus]